MKDSIQTMILSSAVVLLLAYFVWDGYRVPLDKNYSDDLRRVKNIIGKIGYEDISGKLIIPCQYNEASPFF